MTSPEPTPKASITDRIEEIWKALRGLGGPNGGFAKGSGFDDDFKEIIADLRAQEKALQEAIEDLEKLMFYKWGSATYVNDPFWLGMLAHLQKLKALLASATPKAPEGTKP